MQCLGMKLLPLSFGKLFLIAYSFSAFPANRLSLESIYHHIDIFLLLSLFKKNEPGFFPYVC